MDSFPKKETAEASMNIEPVRTALVRLVDWKHGTGMDLTYHTPSDSSRP